MIMISIDGEDESIFPRPSNKKQGEDGDYTPAQRERSGKKEAQNHYSS